MSSCASGLAPFAPEPSETDPFGIEALAQAQRAGPPMEQIQAASPEAQELIRSMLAYDEEKSCICTISLKVDMAAKGLIDVLSKNLAVNWDVVRIGSANWKDQFICALYVNGSPEGQMEASLTAWVSHVLFVPWKLFFALIPPTDYADGFACLIPCLALMAVIIVLIADSAANL